MIWLKSNLFMSVDPSKRIFLPTKFQNKNNLRELLEKCIFCRSALFATKFHENNSSHTFSFNAKLYI